ncbi:unnamed protein product, partial [marine sediment metagenome]
IRVIASLFEEDFFICSILYTSYPKHPKDALF